MEEVGAALPYQVPVLERDRPVLLDDGGGAAAHGLDPRRHLLGVRHRGREAHEGHLRRQVDDHLFPHRSAVAVLEVVHLVEHDVAQAVERGRRRVDHVAKDLGGHHHDRCLAVERVVAGESPTDCAVGATRSPYLVGEAP
jgi:hypothetical protein